MLQLLKAPFLVLHFSYYTIPPDDVICDIVIYADVLLSILSAIRDLICGNSLNWLLNLNLIYETL